MLSYQIFISTVGSDANYLHIDGTIPTFIGNGGKPIGSVLLDFDGEVRSLTNPDIGADEFISVAPDCAVYISPANGATDQSTSNHTLSWTPSTGTSGYDVYFDQNPTPTTLISSNQVGATYNTGVLSVNTTYYWQIVPKNLSGSATGCAVWSFTTINPTLSTTPTSLVYTNQCINTPSSEQTFKMNAANLDGTFVTITAPLGLKVSADNVTYSSSINVNHTGGSFTNKTIYVKYTAYSSAAFSNNIVISGGGLTSAVDVAVSATTLTATPSFVATATGATLVAGDYLWNGLTSIAWDNAVNWYQYNGTAFEESNNIPLATDRVFILPSNAGNNCITATNTATVNVLAGNGNANDFFIGSGATVVIDASKTLAIKGNWTNNGTFSPASTSNVTFDGNLAQSIGGSNSTTFSSLTINNTSNTLTLNKPVSVLETLSMTSGNIKSTATNLLTIGNSTTNPGSIAWSEGAIVGPLKRYFSSVASSTQDSGIFPVGKNNLNRYAQINYTSGLSTGGTITAEYIQGVCPVAYAGLPATVSGALIQNYEEEGYWSIAASGGNLNAATYTLKLRGNALSSPSSITTLRIIKSVNHTSWDNAGIGMHAAATGSNSDFIITNSGLTGFSWFNIGSNNANPLPVKLLNFKASCKENQVNLNWATGSERNSAIFIVDRSTDLTTWQQVNIQKAAGNSSQKIDYHATDDQAQQGVNYYRLTQIDLNGEQEVFDPISIQCANNNVDVIIYPNPSTGNFTLEIESLTKQTQVNIQLSDLTGKKLEQRVVNLKAGNNEFNFLVNLKAGIYLIQVENSHVNYPVLKLEIQH
ncbi:MAG: T9SS type A sorting domain-containing protein [Crocinitomicaceae bacterium]|nr:T9SS type A sorting domain-containing protein [Crocinitomicaceae bacterium]